MQIRIGLETNVEGRSLAWALDFPGCFAYGADNREALVEIPQALLLYQAWIAGHDRAAVHPLDDFDVRLVEVWEGYALNDRYEVTREGGHAVNAWFREDWLPLTRVEVQHGLRLLQWSREDLLETVAGARPGLMEAQFPGERWSIAGILGHVGSAEWWYLDRLNLADVPRSQLSRDPVERMRQVRERLTAVLPELAGEERVTGKLGEWWSPRKLLRRALWHEMDHREHIRKLLVASDE